MLKKQRKNRIYAFLSMFCLQMGPPHQTLRARLFWPLRALGKLESLPDLLAFSCLLRNQNSHAEQT